MIGLARLEPDHIDLADLESAGMLVDMTPATLLAHVEKAALEEMGCEES